MKKYFLGLSAIVLAVAFSSFTKISKQVFAEDRVFEFVGDVEDQNSVADPANYLYIGTISEGLCDGLNQPKACRVAIDHTKLTTQTPSVGTSLETAGNSLFTITAGQLTSPFYRIVSVQKPSVSYTGIASNQANL